MPGEPTSFVHRHLFGVGRGPFERDYAVALGLDRRGDGDPAFQLRGPDVQCADDHWRVEATLRGLRAGELVVFVAQRALHRDAFDDLDANPSRGACGASGHQGGVCE